MWGILMRIVIKDSPLMPSYSVSEKNPTAEELKKLEKKTPENKDSRFSSNKEIINFVKEQNDLLRAQIFSETPDDLSLEGNGRLLLAPSTTSRHSGQRQFGNKLNINKYSSHQNGEMKDNVSISKFAEKQNRLRIQQKSTQQAKFTAYLCRKR